MKGKLVPNSYYWARPFGCGPFYIAELRREDKDVLYFCGDEVDRCPDDYEMIPVETFLGRQPDLRMDIYMSEIGYQGEVYREGVHLGGECRDFPKDYEGEAYEEKLDNLYQRVIATIKEWKNEI